MDVVDPPVVLTPEQEAAAAPVTPLPDTPPVVPEILVTPDTAPPEDNPEEPVDEDDPLAFWNSVDTLRGEPLKVDYGNTVPNSPEGALVREKAIEEHAINKWETWLEKSDPRSYAYMLHRSRGGSDEDFMKTEIPVLPEYETFKSSVDLQAGVYRRDLLNKGIDPELVETVVRAAIKDEKIFDKADAVYQKAQLEAQSQVEKLNKQIEADDREFSRRATEMANVISGTIGSQDLGVVIPEDKKADFSRFMNEMVREQNGQFYLLQALDRDSVKELTTAMYFLFRKGNLDDLVARKAKTFNTQRLKIAVSKTRDQGGATTEGSKQVTTMGDI